MFFVAFPTNNAPANLLLSHFETTVIRLFCFKSFRLSKIEFDYITHCKDCQSLSYTAATSSSHPRIYSVLSASTAHIDTCIHTTYSQPASGRHDQSRSSNRAGRADCDIRPSGETPMRLGSSLILENPQSLELWMLHNAERRFAAPKPEGRARPALEPFSRLMSRSLIEKCYPYTYYPRVQNLRYGRTRREEENDSQGTALYVRETRIHIFPYAVS